MGKFKNTRFYVVDSVMGSGKTSAAINMINESDDDTRFFFITPYLAQVDRIIRSCPGKQFEQPVVIDDYSKRRNLIQLVKDRKNIASTHAMFKCLTPEIMELFHQNEYTLIMDETFITMEENTLCDLEDIRPLFNFGILTAPGKAGIVGHNLGDTNSKITNPYKNMCDNKMLGYCNTSGGDMYLLRLFPIDNFLAFKEVYIMTYMFGGQIIASYFRLHGIRWMTLGVAGTDVSDYHFSLSPTVSLPFNNISELIRISYKRNDIGLENSLSHTWYDKKCNKETIRRICKNTYNFFHNDLRIKPRATIWTCFKSSLPLFEKDKTFKPYVNSFVPINAKASNDYADRTAVAYPVNIFYKPYIKNFIQAGGIEFDEDMYATSEMLQFIWRSAIRRGEPIDLYIPSTRMRNLLQKWIENISC